MAFLKGVLYGVFLGAGPSYLLLVCFFAYARKLVVLQSLHEGQSVGMAVLLSEALASPYLWGVALGAGVLAPVTILFLWTLKHIRL